MSEKQASHVLFYSNRCKFSNQVLAKANKIKDIECVNIEQIQQVPSYVKGVPALLIDRNNIVYGAKVFEFVKNKSESQINAVNSQIGDYSFIEDSDNLTNGYTFIDDDASIFGEQPPEQTDSERGEYNDPNIIEKLIADRANDLPVAPPRV
jgi:glutaredoxin-related protein